MKAEQKITTPWGTAYYVSKIENGGHWVKHRREDCRLCYRKVTLVDEEGWHVQCPRCKGRKYWFREWNDVTD